MAGPRMTATFSVVPAALRYEAIGKPWVEPLPPSHILAAWLPADLPAGAHTITVRAIGEFGQQLVWHLAFEVLRRQGVVACVVVGWVIRGVVRARRVGTEI
jgi:hypothetical protein